MENKYELMDYSWLSALYLNGIAKILPLRGLISDVHFQELLASWEPLRVLADQEHECEWRAKHPQAEGAYIHALEEWEEQWENLSEEEQREVQGDYEAGVPSLCDYGYEPPAWKKFFLSRRENK